MTSSVFREQAGLGISVPIPLDEPGFVYDTSSKEAVLTQRLSESGKKGDWTTVNRLVSSYTGSAVPVYNAAMQAAYRCGQYRAALDIYRRLREMPKIRISPVTLHLGIKICGKLNQAQEVDNIWNEIVENNWVDEIRAGGRIDAAAEMGDIQRAAEGLDYMIQSNLTVEVHHFNSAINACSNAYPPSKSAAMFLFKQLCNRDLKPTIVTYGTLVKAHRLAKLEELIRLRQQMRIRGIQTNCVFADNYVRSLLRARDIPYARPEVVALLAEVGEDRLREAREAIRDFNRMDCMTPLCRRVEQALS